MQYKIPTHEELKADLIRAMVRLKVHHPDPETEIVQAWAIVEEVAVDMPPKPRHLRIVPTNRS